ncbi:unnamed protein product [Periconia digitata]|uniref:Uncharacterized protein n=1 Tax=Periconia digitata TaxID=1303443 RepID=A0A9W4UL92_9PLEO|nr:unnamed protein product [Periconia digitata]
MCTCILAPLRLPRIHALRHLHCHTIAPSSRYRATLNETPEQHSTFDTLTWYTGPFYSVSTLLHARHSTEARPFRSGPNTTYSYSPMSLLVGIPIPESFQISANLVAALRGAIAWLWSHPASTYDTLLHW